MSLRDKKVRFWFEIDQKVIPCSGTLRTHRVKEGGKLGEKYLVDIDTTEFARPTDPPNLYFLVHLEQAYIDSIAPAKQNDIGIDCEVKRHFLYRH